MTTVTGDDGASADALPPDGEPAPSTGLGPMALAGVASLGAGAIHAAAVGVHGDHGQAAQVFAAIAVLQIGWGALALVARRPAAAWAGLVVNGGAFAGWVLAKTQGISFIDGMEQAEDVQLADGAAAVLALVAVALLVGFLVQRRVRASATRVAPASVLAAASALVLVASAAAMTSVSDHSHSGADGHAHGDDEAHAAGDHTSTDDAEGEHAEGGHAEGEHEEVVLPTKEYDPEAPIDLSGVPGVTPAEQARAENLIAITLDRLPNFADYKVAEAKGFHSIGDGFTGHEHFINWSYINDDQILNPDYPESLVYEIGADGSKKLVSAMFMLRRGTALDDVPEVGGKLTQWHVHDDLCFTDDPEQPRVAGVTAVGGTCQPPLQKFDPTPMIHVWIVKHPCGPFAALEGVAGGQVAEGETHFCNTAHGSH